MLQRSPRKVALVSVERHGWPLFRIQILLSFRKAPDSLAHVHPRNDVSLAVLIEESSHPLRSADLERHELVTLECISVHLIFISFS
jgi:hypothetical protein